jgi:hypothetical protein
MNYKKFIVLSVLIVIANFNALAQINLNSNDSLDIHDTIAKLFEGIREGDSAKVHAVFYDNVRMLTSFTTNTGERKLKGDNLHTFLQAIANGHKEIWDERISNTHIQIDGDLAQVWTDYTFYVDEELSHCGVDAFQIVRDKNGIWKIIHLIDTRRKTGCE